MPHYHVPEKISSLKLTFTTDFVEYTTTHLIFLIGKWNHWENSTLKKKQFVTHWSQKKLFENVESLYVHKELQENLYRYEQKNIQEIDQRIKTSLNLDHQTLAKMRYWKILVYI